MDELDTENVEPLLHMSANVNTMREDMVKGSIDNEAALKNAKKQHSPYFIVPTVIKK
jgi:aspartyl-tRNA(Asn)/glutamyl-tRNA(Gln) amidotransferase subunit C